jgi:Flp pilus assembly protein TadD
VLIEKDFDRNNHVSPQRSEVDMDNILIPGELEELERRFAAKPGDVEVALALANAYADQGRWEEAVKLYKIAIELDPENGDLYNRLGIVFVSIDDPVEAEESYLQAIRLSPMNPESYYNLGELYRIQHRWSNAKYMFEKCLQLADDYDMRMEVREKLISL